MTFPVLLIICIIDLAVVAGVFYFAPVPVAPLRPFIEVVLVMLPVLALLRWRPRAAVMPIDPAPDVDALWASEERLRVLAESCRDAVFQLDLRGDILYLSPAFFQLTGIMPETMLGKPLAALLPESERHVVSEMLRWTLARELHHPFAVTAHHNDGRLLTLEVCAAPTLHDGTVAGVQGSLRDISERTRLAATLKVREARFGAVFNSPAMGVMLLNDEGWPVECNRALLRMLGYSAQELGAMSFTAFTHPDDVVRVLKCYHELTLGKAGAFQVEARYVTKDRRTIWVCFTMSTLRDDDGAVQALAVTLEEITERKLAGEKMQLVEHLLRRSSDGVAITDAGGIIQFVNPTFCARTSLRAEETTGMSLMTALHLPDNTLQQHTFDSADSCSIELPPHDSANHFTLTLIALRDAQGTITRFVAMLQDGNRAEVSPTLAEMRR